MTVFDNPNSIRLSLEKTSHTILQEFHMMVMKLLLFILLQFILSDIATCQNLKCGLVLETLITRTPLDYDDYYTLEKDKAEYSTWYRIRRPSGEIIKSTEEHGKTEWYSLDRNKGSCSGDIHGDPVYTLDNGNYNAIIENCAEGEYNFESTGIEGDGRSADDDTLWHFNTKFRCDGKEVPGLKNCNDYQQSGVVIKLKCTEPILAHCVEFEEKYLTTSVDEEKYKELWQKYEILRGMFRYGYPQQMASCNYQIHTGKWELIHEPCKIFFFEPIISVIASYRKSIQIENQAEVDQYWTNPNGMKIFNWNQIRKDQAELMIKALTKDDGVNANLFKREMIYTLLSRENPEKFPMARSPLSERKYMMTLYQYAREANDDGLQNVFKPELDLSVARFCGKETTPSDLCAYVAFKNKYDRSILSIPEFNPITKVVSLSADFGEDGLFASFKDDLDRYLQTTEITDSLDDLATRFSEYFSKLAQFDNAIAQADVGYLQAAIEKSNEQLSSCDKGFKESIQAISADQQTCAAWSLFESIFMVGLSIAATVASGGAVPINVASISGLAGSAKTFAKVGEVMRVTHGALTSFQGAAEQISNKITNEKEAKTRANAVGVAGTFNEMFTRLKANEVNIGKMNDIVQALLGEATWDTVQEQVQHFVTKYTDYYPAGTKTDLVVLNEKYVAMLDSFEAVFKGSGLFCSLAVPDAPAKVRDAKMLWTQMHSLLSDIYDQQFELITALMKTVRSMLDMEAAKRIAPGPNQNLAHILQHRLTIRVAAQQVCDTYKFLNNDGQGQQNNQWCDSIRNTIFVSESIGSRINEIAVQNRLEQYPTSRKFVYIPVSDTPSLNAITFEDLIAGKIVEFEVPDRDNPTDNSFLSENRWSDYPDKISLIRSLEVFIPDLSILEIAQNRLQSVRFKITTTQDSVKVNRKSDTRRYTLKSRYPISTEPDYTVHERICDRENIQDNVYVDDGPKYCVHNRGFFGNWLNRQLPISMYSKFQIHLKNGGDMYDAAAIEKFKLLTPVGGTLKIAARIQIFSPGQRQRTGRPNVDSSMPPMKKYCTKEITQGCTPCPPGSVPLKTGIYCISEEAAKKLPPEMTR